MCMIGGRLFCQPRLPGTGCPRKRRMHMQSNWHSTWENRLKPSRGIGLAWPWAM